MHTAIHSVLIMRCAHIKHAMHCSHIVTVRWMQPMLLTNLQPGQDTHVHLMTFTRKQSLIRQLLDFRLVLKQLSLPIWLKLNLAGVCLHCKSAITDHFCFAISKFGSEGSYTDSFIYHVALFGIPLHNVCTKVSTAGVVSSHNFSLDCHHLDPLSISKALCQYVVDRSD